MSAYNYLLACLISVLPGPPSVQIEEAHVQLLPINKNKCHIIDPIRDISYQLFTRHNPLLPDHLLIGDDEALAKSHMNFSEPTILYFHPFFESSLEKSATSVKTAYLQRKDHNIILLNAPRLEAAPWFLTASRNTRVVGEYTAIFIDYLVSRGLYLPSLHLVGFSLGAQMAGVAGANVRNGRISRITGLDPAGPPFTKWPKSLKLDSGDAEFVDVIHAAAGIFGYPRSIGHVDFWPNQGKSPQPGCEIEAIRKRNPDAKVELDIHWRAYQFYAESVINEHGFLAIACDNRKDYLSGNCGPNQTPINMGFGVPYGITGNYYLTTRPSSPFSLQ